MKATPRASVARVTAEVGIARDVVAQNVTAEVGIARDVVAQNVTVEVSTARDGSKDRVLYRSWCEHKRVDERLYQAGTRSAAPLKRICDQSNK